MLVRIQYSLLSKESRAQKDAKMYDKYASKTCMGGQDDLFTHGRAHGDKTQAQSKTIAQRARVGWQQQPQGDKSHTCPVRCYVKTSQLSFRPCLPQLPGFIIPFQLIQQGLCSWQGRDEGLHKSCCGCGMRRVFYHAARGMQVADPFKRMPAVDIQGAPPSPSS